MSIFGVALSLVLLAFETLLDVIGDLLFHVREREIPLYEFDCFGDPWMSLHWIVVMLFDAVLLLIGLYSELPLQYWELLGVVLEYS